MRKFMVISANDRAEDDGSIYVTFRVIIVIMIFKAWKNLWVFYLVEAFVVLCYQTLLKENNGVFMAIADIALVLLAKFPLVRRVNLEKSLLWVAVIMWILVPYQLGIIDFPRQHKRINLVSMISTYSLACFWLKLNLILFYQRTLLDHQKPVFIVFSTYYLFFFLIILLRVVHLIYLVLPLSPSNCF